MAFSVAAERSTSQPPKRSALVFISVTVFLGSMGVGLITPGAPFFVSRYIPDPDQLGVVLGWLTSIYAVCQFLAAPALGVLSDRVGRRPVLLVCLLGSAVGYLVFGIGGALWVLFVSRIIDGITGANIAVSLAYIADITAPEERGRYFGLIGAIAGIGFILGPSIGGLLSKLGYEAPLYAAAAITFGNVIYGLLLAPESLSEAARARRINTAQLNPFSVLFQVFSMRALRWLLVVTFLYSLPLAMLQSNVSLFTKDTLRWDADTVGLLLTIFGITSIVVQGVLLARLLRRFGEKRVAVAGLCSEVVGYVLIASIVFVRSPLLILMGVIFFAMGDGLLGPAIGGMLSGAAGEHNQGQVQGGSQAVQSLARIAGPVVGGLLYDSVNHAAPYLSGAAIVLLAALFMMAVLPVKHTGRSPDGLATE